MSSNNAENFNFKVSNLSENKNNNKNFKKKEKRVLRPPTLKFIHDTIDKKDYDPAVKEGLKKSASSYPHHALQRWIDQFDLFLAKARRDARDQAIAESKALKAKKQNAEVSQTSNQEVDIAATEQQDEAEVTEMNESDSLSDKQEIEVVDLFPSDYDPEA